MQSQSAQPGDKRVKKGLLFAASKECSSYTSQRGVSLNKESKTN
jgi:hypothetical protein